MGIYYVLTTDKYHGEQSKIGDIMNGISNSLYQQTGLCLAPYMGPTTEEINHFFSSQGMELLSEEILLQNMTDNEKKEKIIEYLTQIGSTKKELLLIDPYLFASDSSDYVKLLIDILSESKFETIHIITERKNTKIKVREQVTNALNGKILITYSGKIHDRYWITNREKGFTLGTSLNGIGKKYCSIQYLDKQDVDDIVKITNEMKQDI